MFVRFEKTKGMTESVINFYFYKAFSIVVPVLAVLLFLSLGGVCGSDPMNIFKLLMDRVFFLHKTIYQNHFVLSFWVKSWEHLPFGFVTRSDKNWPVQVYNKKRNSKCMYRDAQFLYSLSACTFAFIFTTQIHKICKFSHYAAHANFISL